MGTQPVARAGAGSPAAALASTEFSYDRPEHLWSPRGPESQTKIRLLKLAQPLSSDGAFHGTLSWADLSEISQFTALSYAWGTGVLSRHILISGQKLPITATLEVALRRIAQDPHINHDKLLLWIDQICINQQDMAEKTEQVQAMGSIYRAAEEVLVWLGESADNSDVFLKLFRRIGQWGESWRMQDYYTIEKIYTMWDILKNVNPEDPKTRSHREFCEHILPEFDFSLLKAIHLWNKRPWFTRVWVVQEYALAKKPILMCGQIRISAMQMLLARQIYSMSLAKMLLIRGCHPYPSLTNNTSEDFHAELHECWRNAVALGNDDHLFKFVSARKRREKADANLGVGNTLYRLLQTLYVNYDMQTTDSRDKVMGILGLAKDALHLDVEGLDYQTPVKLIYTRVAKAVISHGGIGLLNSAQSEKLKYTSRLSRKDGQSCKLNTPSFNTDLPSWVPDWRQTLQGSFEHRRWNDTTGQEVPSLFSAGGTGSTLELRKTASETILGLEGYMFDVVKVVGSAWYGGPQITNVKESKGGSDGGTGSIDDLDWTNEPIPKNIIGHDKTTLRFLEEVQKICSIKLELETVDPLVQERLAEAVWRVPIGDLERTSANEDVRALSSFKCAYEFCLKRLRSFVEESRLPADRRNYSLEDLDPKRPDLYQLSLEKMLGKRPFRTSKSWVGMGPPQAQINDFVVVFKGAPIPFVLRQIENGMWRLIGECFCYGAMDGEAIQPSQKRLFNIE